jgi:radical SAM superfamily enzyme YgiQ (UPF0313 family)
VPGNKVLITWHSEPWSGYRWRWLALPNGIEFGRLREKYQGATVPHVVETSLKIAGGMNGIMIDAEARLLHGAACWRADGMPMACSGGNARADSVDEDRMCRGGAAGGDPLGLRGRDARPLTQPSRGLSNVLTDSQHQTVMHRSSNEVSLRNSGAVLLVSCYELGHQPLNLAFPLAYLRDAGFAPRAVDTAVQTLDDDAIQAARFVAISVPMHTALRLGSQVADRVRAINPDAMLCFYGLYSWLNADYLLGEYGGYVIGGEFERPLLRLVEALDDGFDAQTIEGVSTLAHRVPPSLERVDFPMPERRALPAMRHYAHLIIDGTAVPSGYTEATRGCHHTCLHCPVVPVYQGRFFAIPRPVVLEDISRQVAQGAGHITFGDPDFLNGPTHSLRICRELHERFPNVTFDMTTRIEHIIQHRDLMPEFGRLGCVFAVSAVESVSERVLTEIDKGHTKRDVIEALSILESADIAMRPSLLPFTPWTTLDDYRELLTFIEEYDLVENVDPVHLSIRLLIPPGSALLERSETRDWLGPLDAAAYTYRWTHPDPRLDDLQRQIGSLVERATLDGQEPAEVFAQVKALAWSSTESPAPTIRPLEKGVRRRPPRLTESWFC